MSKYVCPKCGESNCIYIEYNYTHPQRYDGISEVECRECGCRTGRWTGNILPDDFHEPRFGEWIVYKICSQIPHNNDRLWSACGEPYFGENDPLTLEYKLDEWTRPKEGYDKLYCYETFKQALDSGYEGMMVKCIGEGITPGYNYDTEGELRAEALKPIRIYEHTDSIKEKRSRT